MPPKKRNVDDKSDAPPAKLNKTSSDFANMDFSPKIAQSENGKDWNFKISTWNVDGLRAWLKKGGLDFLKYEGPDILCLQEIKCSNEKLPPELKTLDNYKHQYYFPAEKDGYSGVALLSKTKPLKVNLGLGNKDHDAEGRVITAEYDEFFLVTTYVPNAGRKLVTLDKRM